MGDNDKVCEGCTSHKHSHLFDKGSIVNPHFVGCEIPINIGDIYCPCLECIIRVTCQEGCDKYFNYLTIVREGGNNGTQG